MVDKTVSGGINPSTGLLDSKIYTGSRAGWGLDSGHYQGYLAPVAVHPRPDSETSQYARHRINATGQKYRIPIVVGHGAWPFKYEILNAPTGVTIGQTLTLSGNSLVAGADYGVLEWLTPTAGTYTFLVLVVDQNGVKTYLSWTLVVNDSNWVVLDISAATNGTGTLASPFNALSSLTDLTNKGCLIRGCTVDWQTKVYGLERMPRAYVPYAGETVYMKQANSPIGCASGSDYSFTGVKFFIPADRTTVGQFFRLGGGPDRVGFFECEFDGGSYDNTDTVGWYGDAPKSNSSIIMFTNTQVDKESLSNSWHSYIVGCAFKNVQDRDMYLGYSQRMLVIENCTMENCKIGSIVPKLGQGFYVKMSVDGVTFRNNRSIGDGNTQVLLRIDAYAGDFAIDNIDVCYNNYKWYGFDASYYDGLGAITNGTDYGHFAGTKRYIYRNSLYAPNVYAAALHASGQDAASIVTADRNVMVSGVATANGVWLRNYLGDFRNTNHLAGNVAAGIVDSNNKLQGAYLSNLGTKGAEVI